MKAIQTEYNGDLFRSRLEARWAVFFDAMGIAYDYEPEGFDLGGAGYYLPDFYLPELDMWVEIKPKGVRLEVSALIKAVFFGSLYLTKGSFIISNGLPENDFNFYLAEGKKGDHGGNWNEGHFCVWGVGRRCEEEIWVIEREQVFAKCLKPIPHERDHKYPSDGDISPKLKAAYKAAKQARFEHGEKPLF